MEKALEFLAAVEWKELNATISGVASLLLAIGFIFAVIRTKKITEAFREFRTHREEIFEMVEAIRRLNEIGVEIDRLDSIIPRLKVALQDFEETFEDDISELKKPLPVELGKKPVAFPAKELELTLVVDPTSKWQELRNIWREVRDRIEDVIEKLDGRIRRPYNNLSRVSYADVINKLRADGWLTEMQADAANQMNRRFLQLKPTPKSEITDSDVQNFKNWKNAFDGSSGSS